jgi:subtilisin family serine protease
VDIGPTLVSELLVACRIQVLLMVAAVAWLCFPRASFAVLVSAQGAGAAAFREDRFFIQPSAASPTALQDLHRKLGTTVLREFKSSGDLILLSVPSNHTVASLVAQYQASGLVRFAEPDYIVHAACGPNDPRFKDGSQWAFWNYGQTFGKADADIDAVEAWSRRTSATNVIVAVVDTGVRTSHEDLEANLWTNPVDGSFGTNAIAGTTEPWDDNGHGTQMAGIIGAVGNNGLGITGIAWRARIMACKFLDKFGNGAISDGIACIEFARTNGAKLINLSWGETNLTVDGTNYALSLSNAIAQAQADNVVFVAAAGNHNSPSLDIDSELFFPASLPLDNLVAVANSTRADNLSQNSNYGATNVDLAAPGNGILSTGASSDTSYVTESGTSHAAAMVTGAMLLVRAQFPSDDYRQSIQRVLANVDPVPALQGMTLTGGRLNLRKALGVPGGSQPTVTVTCGPSNVVVKVMGTPCAGYTLEASTNLTDWEGVLTSLTSVSGEMLFVPDPESVPFRFFRAYAEP